MDYTGDEIRAVLEDFPHGGGTYYTEAEGKLDPDAADVTVTSASGLQSEAGPNHTIEIAADMDLTGWEIDIGNSTLVGDRGWGGSDGPLLSTDTYGNTSGGAGSGRPYAALYATGSDTPRVTGIQMEGFYPVASERSYAGDEDLQRGIWLNGDGGEVDNCDIYGFTWAGVMVGGLWGSYGENHGVDIHHCMFDLTMQDGYGYGVNFARGSGTVDQCYFNHNRHSINGQGRYFCSYTVSESIFGPDMIGHMVDQHCLAESGHSDNTDSSHQHFGLRAGGATEARDCTFLHGGHAVGTARGEPWEYFEINDCWISHSSIPTHNSGNSRSGAWYQQNVHGISTGGTTYSRLAPDGEYTSEWGTSGNELGANDSSVSWSSDVGASVNFQNPENSPAYQGWDDDYTPPTPTGDLSVFAEDADTGSRIDGAEVYLEWLEDDPHEDDDEGPHEGVTGDSDVADGGHDFGDLPIGYYHIEVNHDDYELGTYDEDLWRDSGEESNEAMYLDTDGRLPIIYLDYTGEEPPSEWYQESDADGIVDFGPREYDVDFEYAVSADGYDSATGVYTNDSSSIETIDLDPEIDEEEGVVFVTVSNEADDGIEGVIVRLYEAE